VANHCFISIQCECELSSSDILIAKCLRGRKATYTKDTCTKGHKSDIVRIVSDAVMSKSESTTFAQLNKDKVALSLDDPSPVTSEWSPDRFLLGHDTIIIV